MLGEDQSSGIRPRIDLDGGGGTVGKGESAKNSGGPSRADFGREDLKAGKKPPSPPRLIKRPRVPGTEESETCNANLSRKRGRKNIEDEQTSQILGRHRSNHEKLIKSQ